MPGMKTTSTSPEAMESLKRIEKLSAKIKRHDAQIKAERAERDEEIFEAVHHRGVTAYRASQAAGVKPQVGSRIYERMCEVKGVSKKKG